MAYLCAVCFKGCGVCPPLQSLIINWESSGYRKEIEDGNLPKHAITVLTEFNQQPTFQC